MVFSAIASARDVAVSSLSLAEVTSALKRHQLEGGFSQADELRAFKALLEDWETFDFLAFDVQLNEAARGIVRIFEP